MENIGGKITCPKTNSYTHIRIRLVSCFLLCHVPKISNSEDQSFQLLLFFSEKRAYEEAAVSSGLVSYLKQYVLINSKSSLDETMCVYSHVFCIESEQIVWTSNPNQNMKIEK